VQWTFLDGRRFVVQQISAEIDYKVRFPSSPVGLDVAYT
jgi:hypothetical protein